MAEEAAVPEKEVSREELYKQYQESGTPPVEEKKEEVTEQPPEEVVQPPEAEKKEEVKEEVKEPQKKEQQVPYAALHEERMKRQAEAKAKKEAEARAKELEEELSKLRSQKQPEEEKPIDDYEAALREQQRITRELKMEVEAQKNVEQSRQVREREQAQREAIATHQKIMSDIDKELADEGYGGFAFAKDRVAAELRKMIAEDESNTTLDTKEGWKKIYREKVHPEAAQAFALAQQKREKLDKEALKKQANIHTPPNSIPAKKKGPDDLTEAEMRENYLKMRRGE